MSSYTLWGRHEDLRIQFSISLNFSSFSYLDQVNLAMNPGLTIHIKFVCGADVARARCPGAAVSARQPAGGSWPRLSPCDHGSVACDCVPARGVFVSVCWVSMCVFRICMADTSITTVSTHKKKWPVHLLFSHWLTESRNVCVAGVVAWRLSMFSCDTVPKKDKGEKKYNEKVVNSFWVTQA